MRQSDLGVSDIGTREVQLPLVKAELKAARRTAFLVSRVLLTILREEGHDTFAVQRIVVKKAVRLRLGIWQTWATRYRVPLRYVIKTLLTFWRQKTRRPGKKNPILGVSIAALTSKKSEPILQSAIEHDFPGGENISQWKTQQQMKLLGLDQPRGRAKSLAEMFFSEDNLAQNCSIYQNRIERRQKRLDKAAAAAWRRRRAWRNNPWL